MKLYTVKDDYIKYLREFDNNVPYNKEGRRPYVGIVLKVNEMNYFAPLSSPKVKHLEMKDNPTLTKISGGDLGVINFNNMIPIATKELKIFTVHDLKNRNLIDKQIRWIKSNKKNICHKAKKLYDLYSYKKLKNNHFKICNNFKLLEEKCKKWGK